MITYHYDPVRNLLVELNVDSGEVFKFLSVGRPDLPKDDPPPAAKKKPGPKSRTGTAEQSSKSDALVDEIEGHYKKRKHLTAEQTAKIETALLLSRPVAEVAEREGVSKSIVYVIKVRLKKEGKL